MRNAEAPESDPLTELLTERELAEAWKTSTRTIRHLRQEGLPFVRIGRLVRYYPTEVEGWLRARQADTAA